MNIRELTEAFKQFISMNEISDEPVKQVSNKRKLDAIGAIDRLNRLDADFDKELDEIRAKYTDEEIIEGKADKEVEALIAKYEPLRKDDEELVHKMEKFHNLLLKRQAKKSKTESKIIESETRGILPIKFVCIDEWNRPIFKPVNKDKKYFLSDVNNLFSEGATEEEVKKFYADHKDTPLRDCITFHGYEIDTDPDGSKLKFDLEIV